MACTNSSGRLGTRSQPTHSTGPVRSAWPAGRLVVGRQAAAGPAWNRPAVDAVPAGQPGRTGSDPARNQRTASSSGRVEVADTGGKALVQLGVRAEAGGEVGPPRGS